MTSPTFPRPGAGPFDDLPVALFGSVMGLTGLSVAWRLAQSLYGLPRWGAAVLGVIAVLSFLAMSVAYGVKLATSFDAVRAEFRHPVAVNTFATFWVSLLLLPMVLAPYSLPAARVSWSLGAVGILWMAWHVVGRWLQGAYALDQVAPAWLLPVVGLLDLPLAAPILDLPHLGGAMQLGLAAGSFLTLPVFTMVLGRLVLQPPLPRPLEPSLLILVAPSAVGMSTYVATTGHVDLFAKSLYCVSLFILAVLAGRLRHLAHCCPFRVGWWAISFPLAACAIAALRFAQAVPGIASDVVAGFLLALASVLILWMLARTLLGIAQGALS